MRFVSPQGWATFAWQSDYGQFHLIDRADTEFAAPVEFTAEMETRRLAVLPAGLVVYTNDCLQQQIRVSIYDEEPEAAPVEPFTGTPWTQDEVVDVRFPSKSFALSSPSHPTPLPLGPVFGVQDVAMRARIRWMEFQGGRDDSVPVEPDVVDVSLWPPR